MDVTGEGMLMCIESVCRNVCAHVGGVCVCVCSGGGHV